MSCADELETCCKKSDDFSRKADFDKAIDIVKQIDESDITTEHQYLDKDCHGCLVGHILKVTDGLTYDQMNQDITTGRYETKDQLMKQHFGEDDAWLVDSELSNIHSDYANNLIDIDEMKEHAIECLTKLRDGESYEYISMEEDDYDDDYYDDDEDEDEGDTN